MGDQLSFASLEFGAKKKRTKRDVFLGEMAAVVPWVMCGRRPWVKGSFGCQLAVGCKSCVRPVCAAHMAAGPDVIRGSGPNQTLALDSA